MFFVNADSLPSYQHIAEVNSTAVFKLSASRKRKILSFRSETIDPPQRLVPFCTVLHLPILSQSVVLSGRYHNMYSRYDSLE